MNPPHPITAEQFAERLFDLPEAGRWHELVAGEVVMLDPPDEAHGNVVLNLSKAIGEYLGGQRERPVGYACFEIGLIVTRDPDTVRRPAISFFAGGPSFAESDELVTSSVPQLVIEAASTPSRRRSIMDRVEQHHAFGVQHVWVVDPVERVIHCCERARTARQLTESRTLAGEPLLPGFAMSVADVFAEPSWWR